MRTTTTTTTKELPTPTAKPPGALRRGADVADRRRPSGRLAAVTAGALWAPFGAFQLLTPLGAHTRYDVERGFDVVIDPALFALYSLPGAAALISTAMALLWLPAARKPGGRSGVARAVLRVAIALGVVSLIAIAAGVAPVFMAASVLGVPLLGLAALLLALETAGRFARLHLVALAGASAALPAVWPLVWAVGAISAPTGAVVIGAYAFGWTALAHTGWRIPPVGPDPA